MTTSSLEQEERILKEWMDATSNAAMALDPKQYVPKFWSKDTRPDGRFFAQARQTSVVKGILKQHTIGSALVKFLPANEDDNSSSSTQVIAGITCQIGQSTVSGNGGDIVVSCVYNNNHATYNPNNTLGQEQQQQVAIVESWLQRVVNQTMNLQQLGIISKATAAASSAAAFRLCITLVITQSNGNLFDACCLAMIAALKDTVLPTIVQLSGKIWTVPNDNKDDYEKDDKISLLQKSKPFVLQRIPISLSMISTHQNSKHTWIVDPTTEEEWLADGTITIVMDAAAEEDNIVLLESKGKVSMSPVNLALAVKMAQGRAQELKTFL